MPNEDSLVNEFQNLSSPSKDNAKQQSTEDVEIDVVFSEDSDLNDSECSPEINIQVSPTNSY